MPIPNHRIERAYKELELEEMGKRLNLPGLFSLSMTIQESVNKEWKY